jgi:hypothetical protein
MKTSVFDLSCHWTHLRQLRRFDALQPVLPDQAGQVSRTGSVYLKRDLEHIQGTVPAILVAAVVQELELRHVQRQVDPSASSGQALGHAAEGADHCAQPRPGALHGIAVDLVTIAVQVESILARAVVDAAMLAAFAGQEVVDGIAVGVDACAALYHLLDDGANGVGLNVAQDKQAHLPAPAQQAKHLPMMMYGLVGAHNLFARLQVSDGIGAMGLIFSDISCLQVYNYR